MSGSGSGSAPVPIPFVFHWSAPVFYTVFAVLFLGVPIVAHVKGKDWFRWQMPLEDGFMTHGLIGGDRLILVIRIVFFIYSFAIHINGA